MTELTEAEVDRLKAAAPGVNSCVLVDVAEEVERIIDARLAPIRVLTDHDSTEPCGEHGYEIANGCEECSVADALRWQAGRLRAALDAASAPASAQQDHTGTEGQDEGERAGEGCEYVPKSNWTGLPDYPRWAACRCGWESPIRRTTWREASEDHRDHTREASR